MVRSTLWALIVAGGAALAAAVTAQERVSAADSVFLVQAAQNGQAELQVSRLALEKTQNSEVKTFAQRMLDEHTAWAAELAALASAKGVRLPEEASAAQKGDISQLATSDSFHFDQRYAEAMGVHAHEETIALFRRAANDADDADIRAFAARMLPTLQLHLQMARGLKALTAAARPPGN
jgi:putative membrane protein